MITPTVVGFSYCREVSFFPYVHKMISRHTGCRVVSEEHITIVTVMFLDEKECQPVSKTEKFIRTGMMVMAKGRAHRVKRRRRLQNESEFQRSGSRAGTATAKARLVYLVLTSGRHGPLNFWYPRAF